jgi:hypothetical protein
MMPHIQPPGSGSTPMGWAGSYQKFPDTLDRIIGLDPATIVPGHRPACGGGCGGAGPAGGRRWRGSAWCGRGDGTQALVAGIAAQHDLPFLVISAGTRNHFAMDLG